MAASAAFVDSRVACGGFGFLGEDGGGGSVVEVVFAVPFEDAGQQFDGVVRIGGDPVSGDAAVVAQKLVDVGRHPVVGRWRGQQGSPAFG